VTTNKLDKYKKLALELFKKELGDFVAGVDVREDYDFKDDEALFFEIYLDPTAPDNIGKKFILSHLKLREDLEGEDEFRFPYVSTRRPSASAQFEDIIINSDRVNDTQTAGRSTR
jgi:hypothetical protein